MKAKLDNVVTQLQRIEPDSSSTKSLVDASQNLAWVISELVTYLNAMNHDTKQALRQVQKAQTMILDRLDREAQSKDSWWSGLARQVLGSLIPSFITAAAVAMVYLVVIKAP